jgi:hypothetical protein
MSLAGEVQGAILSVPGFDCDTALSADLARPAEILRGGSGIKVDGTVDHGLTISTYLLRMPGELPWQETSRA